MTKAAAAGDADDSVRVLYDSIRVINTATDMIFRANRLKSYKKWPFRANANCTPEKMAHAGFVYMPTTESPDGVICAFCLKELDGWEPEDDPWKEHRSHAPTCYFVKLNKTDEEKWTLEDGYRLMAHRHASLLRIWHQKVVEDLKMEAKEIEALVLNVKEKKTTKRAPGGRKKRAAPSRKLSIVKRGK